MITGDSYIGSNRQHRLSDQVSANTQEGNEDMGLDPLADLPYPGLRDAVIAHLTVAEGLGPLLSNIPPC